MKKNLILILSAMFLISFTTWATGDKKPSEDRAASMYWTKKSHDFGKIKKDQPVTASFAFQNSGDSPLMILSVKGSCGCTVADYTKGEIPSGQYGEVTATYNAAKVGMFKKTVTVNASTGDGPITLVITGEVVE